MILNHGETEQKLPKLLYAEDATLLAKSKGELVRMMGWFNDAHTRRMLKVNKSKMLVFEWEGRFDHKISLHGKELEVVDEFKNLRVKFSTDGSGKAKLKVVMQDKKKSEEVQKAPEQK